MASISFRKLLVLIFLASGSLLTSTSASAQTTGADGEVYQLDIQNNQYIATHQKCSVRVGPVSKKLDTEHGSPRERLSFSYEILGFPQDIRKYSTGTASGLGYSPVHSAQASFEPGIIASFIGDIVYVNFDIAGLSYEEFASRPQFTSIRAYYSNPTKSYFGFSDVRWGYECRFSAN